MKTTKLVSVDLRAIKPSLLRRSQLPVDLERRARAVYGRLGAEFAYAPTFEQFELAFCRDAAPKREIAIWETMATVLEQYLKPCPRANRQEVMGTILNLSVGMKVARKWSRLAKLWKLVNGNRSTCIVLEQR